MERFFTALFVGVVVIAIAAIVFTSHSKGVDITGLLIAVALGIGTIVFLLAGRARRAQAAATPRPGGLRGVPWRPSGRARRICFGAAGILFYSLAIVSWVQPERSSGRWAWLINAMYDTLGPMGPGLLFAIVGTLLIAAAFGVKD